MKKEGLRWEAGLVEDGWRQDWEEGSLADSSPFQVKRIFPAGVGGAANQVLA